MSGAVRDVMPFVAGSYGAAIVVLGFLAVTSLMRYGRARRRMAAVERPDRARRGSVR